MLSPKKVKWRKPQKGNMRGMSNSGDYVSFGTYGLNLIFHFLIYLLLKDIQELASSTNSVTKKIDQMSTDFGKIMEDKELVYALKRVTIGLSKLFDEIYP